eukprot:scaffold149_cov383-Prasinococcus_capsulatus_cf.AAC.12
MADLRLHGCDAQRGGLSKLPSAAAAAAAAAPASRRQRAPSEAAPSPPAAALAIPAAGLPSGPPPLRARVLRASARAAGLGRQGPPRPRPSTVPYRTVLPLPLLRPPRPSGPQAIRSSEQADGFPPRASRPRRGRRPVAGGRGGLLLLTCLTTTLPSSRRARRGVWPGLTAAPPPAGSAVTDRYMSGARRRGARQSWRGLAAG